MTSELLHLRNSLRPWDRSEDGCPWPSSLEICLTLLVFGWRGSVMGGCSVVPCWKLGLCWPLLPSTLPAHSSSLPPPLLPVLLSPHLPLCPLLVSISFLVLTKFCSLQSVAWCLLYTEVYGFPILAGVLHKFQHQCLYPGLFPRSFLTGNKMQGYTLLAVCSNYSHHGLFSHLQPLVSYALGVFWQWELWKVHSSPNSWVL